MPNRRNNPARWVLPEVIDPPDYICVTVPVPNDRQHIAAFWGALYNLTSARFWQDDPAHTALLVAKVWWDIFDALKPASCDVDLSVPIEEWIEEMSICESLRFNEQGKLQGLCCGEWVDIPGQGDKGLGQTGQPGGGSAQPVPGGPPTCYHGNTTANLQWLAPTVVSAGDVITFSNLTGAAWDGTAPYPLPGRWDCPDGKFFFLGECQNGTESTDAGDPKPSAPHMSIVCQIAGVWYSGLSPITVPGGVSNAQVMVQLNDSAIGNNEGQYGFDMCVENNQTTVGWMHEFDFTLSPHGFVASAPSVFDSVWVAGTGWTANALAVAVSNYWKAIAIKLTGITAFTGTKVEADANFVFGFAPDNSTHVQNIDPWFDRFRDSSQVGTPITITFTGTQAGVTEIDVNLTSDFKAGSAGACTGTAVLKKLRVYSNVGTDPF